MAIDWEAVAVGLWVALQSASPWLSPLLWAMLFVVLIVLWVRFKGWAKLKAVFNWMHKAIMTVDQVIKIVDDVTYVKTQLTANGGSTVKDQSKIAAETAQRTAARVEEMHSILEDTRKIAKRAASTAQTAKTKAAETHRILVDHVSATAAKAEQS